MRKMILSMLIAVMPLGLLTGCEQPYVPPPSHTGRDVGITVAVVGAGITITALAVHSQHFIKGCTTAGPDGLLLQTADQRFTLVGAIKDVRPGDVVRIKGKKGKKDKAGKRDFLVEEMAKDFGACKLASVAP